MSKRLDDFKVFINKYPKIKEEVYNQKFTWQQIFEDFVILGENDPRFDIYKVKGEKSTKVEDFLKNTNLQTAIEYIKKINPDNISKTLDTVNKVLQITTNFTSKPNPNLFNANYNSWWD